MPDCFLCHDPNAEHKKFDVGRKIRVTCACCVDYTISVPASVRVQNANESNRRTLQRFVEQTNTIDQLALLANGKDSRTIVCCLAGIESTEQTQLSLTLSSISQEQRVSDISNKKTQRDDFLVSVYEATGGTTRSAFDTVTIGSQLGIDRETSIEIGIYLQERGIVNLLPVGQGFLTSLGIVAAEDCLQGHSSTSGIGLRAADSPRTIINNRINFGDSASSVYIQQGSSEATQSIVLNNQEITKIKEFTSGISSKVDQLDLSPHVRADLLSQIRDVNQELGSESPKQGAVKQGLTSIRNILEGATGSLVAQDLLTQLQGIFALIAS